MLNVVTKTWFAEKDESNKMKNRCLRLRSRPVGKISQTDLEICEEDMPVPEEGQVVVKNLYASIDPTHRIWMSEKRQYMDPVGIDDIMRATTLGTITESKNEDWPVGTRVLGSGGLCDYYLGIPGLNVYYPAGKSGLPLTTELSVCSIVIGLTAWHGINKILKPGPDDIVVLSGAAGAVGSLAGQLAKIKGAKVVGIAGGPTKCSWLTDELGFDCAIDYKSQDVEKALGDFCPDGITCYFDNVGGDVTDAVLQCTRNYARVAICGSISEYDDNWSGIKNFNMILMRRLSVQGFICGDHVADEWQEAQKELVELVSAGKIKYAEDVRMGGLEAYVDVVNLLFSGGNNGKLILQINE